MTNSLKNICLILLMLTITLVTVAGVWFWHDYWCYPSAKQAVLRAEFLPLNTTATGTLVIYVKNRSLVNKGQLLFAIDPDPKRKQEKTAEAALAEVMKKINQNRSRVTAAQNLIEQRQRQISNISKHIYDLQQSGQSSDSTLEHTNLENTKKALASAQEELTKAYQQLGNPAENYRQIAVAKQKLIEAQIRTKITYIYSPENGLVELKLADGTQMTGKMSIGRIIKDNAWWVEAEFEPMPTLNIKPHQLATVTLASNPPIKIMGEVSQISPGTPNKMVTIRLLAVNQPLDNQLISHVFIDTRKIALPHLQKQMN